MRSIGGLETRCGHVLLVSQELCFCYSGESRNALQSHLGHEPLWSAGQVLEWVAMADLPSESVPVVCAEFELLDFDGEDLVDLTVNMLQNILAKS